MNFFQQFGIPPPLVRLISGYLFHSGIDDTTIIKLIENSNLDLTTNLVFYFIENDNDYGIAQQHEFATQIVKFINENTYQMLLALLECYDSDKCTILRKIIEYTRAETIHQSYIRNGSTNEVIQKTQFSYYECFDFNLLDEIAIQACMKRNKIFYNDFVKIFKINRPFPFRTTINWQRRTDDQHNGMYIAHQDIAEYFARRDDVESLNFTVEQIGINELEIQNFLCESCSRYITMYRLPKLKNYIGKYLSSRS